MTCSFAKFDAGSSVKKKLLFIATTPFAVNAFLRTHLLALSDEYQVILCVNLLVYPISEDLHEKINIEHVDIVRKISPIKDLHALYQLLRIFLRTRPEAVHSITPKAGLLAMLAASLAGVPHRFHTFTGQVWATKKGLGRWLLKILDRLIAISATQVFADSASQCRLLETEKIVGKGEVSVLGPGSISGVDIKRFRPNSEIRNTERHIAGTLPTTLVFLFLGRLAKDKGVFDLLHAYSSVATQHPQVELWVVGPDDEHLLAELQTLGAKGQGRIRWCESTTQPERFMAAADVLVLPSYREGFGSVVIEAAACAIPALAYRIDGIVDAVMDNKTGLLVPVGNVGALASAMLQLCEDRDLLQRLGEQACARAIHDFASNSVTAAWAELYHTQLHAR
ncbi:MAG TPA: glycosyltransferase [Methylophilaceae bacterium]|jgi:glycosyltransferase involved in cell wall biosynthesis|nr:glycosyltransferase [Methylophilaceae bacterium]